MKNLSDLTDEQYRALLDDARSLGEQHGRNAASWWEQDAIGGRASGDTRAVARRVLRGINDGDPEILDSLPCPNLSGEWADGMTPAELFAYLDIEVPDDHESDPFNQWSDEICSEYETGASQGAQDEVARLCKSHLTDEEGDVEGER